jgi:RNA:NAD 2'-phosphotransferase (TPT1/KptA family)
MIRITRHRAVQYQLTITRSGWVRLSDVRAKLMNEFSQKFGFLNAQSYVTHERLIDLIINADKPRLGLLREAQSQAYTWVRAWTKHEGLSVKKDGYEQRVEHPDEVPRSAVYPTKWTTFEHHICRAGIKGPLPYRPIGRW